MRTNAFILSGINPNTFKNEQATGDFQYSIVVLYLIILHHIGQYFRMTNLSFCGVVLYVCF